MITLPIGGRAVLFNVSKGLSAWHGWESVVPGIVSDKNDSYAARSQAIIACRERGLITPENHLTPLGRSSLQVLGVVRG